MANAHQDFRRNVLGRSAVRVASLVGVFELLRESIINEFYVAVVLHRQDDVLGLQVSVHDVFAVQVLQRLEDLRCVKWHVAH